MPKIPFLVARVDSEDPDFPAIGLNATHESGVKGWQSARFCEYPVEIGLEFPGGPAHVEKLQLLSHQSKIATQIEIILGSGEDFTNAVYTRLGALSLNDNIQSNWRARELKSVYINKDCQFMKLRLHKCYVNKYNLYNQVGLIAINIIGGRLAAGQLQAGGTNDSGALFAGPVGAGGRAGKSKIAPSLARLMAEDPQYADLAANSAAAVAASKAQAREAQQKAAAAIGSGKMDDLAFDLAFDRRTAEKIRLIAAAKAACVAREDFPGAKALKAVEDQMRAIGVQLARMESQKTTAVAREDFDAAAGLRNEIARLREGVEQRLSTIPAYDAYVNRER